jgi:MFS family permease
VIAAGVAAALHVGKLSPALPALATTLGVTLLQAGFLLSLVQLAGMTLGLAVGLGADSLGLKRSLLAGLVLLAAASALGGWARDAQTLLLLRAVEGLGFLLVSMPAPGLIRQLVPPQRLSPMLGLWGAYMPLGTATALLCGPLVIGVLGWPAWWWLLALASAVTAWAVWRHVPAPAPQPGTRVAQRAAPWGQRLAETLRAPAPWWVALSFAMYSAQWLAVIGFLPTIYAQAGVAASASAVLTALVAAANMIGNIASGRLLARGIAAPLLLAIGFGVMAAGTWLAFGLLPPEATGTGSASLRFAAVLLFSMVGGMIPGALFSLAVRLAPGERTVSTTVGWVQQWSSFGQFAGPPLVAWVASVSGGWHWTWAMTGACSLLGLLLALAIGRQLRLATLTRMPDSPARPSR